MLPKDNELPTTAYKAKQVVYPLGLEIKKIHACPNDYILYHKEYKNLDACPICHTSWFKIRRDDPSDVDGEHTKKRIPGLQRSVDELKKEKEKRFHENLDDFGDHLKSMVQNVKNH
jgi:hypothetical protein